MGMSSPYTAGGRSAQKSRTEKALVVAARALMTGGMTPTVEEAAAEAGISRTTAYRYFPNQRDLFIAAFPFVEMPSLLPATAPPDAAGRLDYVLDRYLRVMLDNEPALRAALRVSLEEHQKARPLLRRGRALPWIREALEPVRSTLGHDGIDRLAKAIRAIAGIEAFVWLTDVAALSKSDAIDLMKWSAHAVLRTAQSAPPPIRAKSPRRRSKR
jgi:AcrR family transcriptional regulator